jgi:hypothetical protein
VQKRLVLVTGYVVQKPPNVVLVCEGNLFSTKAVKCKCVRVRIKCAEKTDVGL